MGVADKDLYHSAGSLLDRLGIQVNRTKSFESSNKDQNKIFGEYLKKMLYNSTPFQPLSPRMFGQ